MGLMTNYSIFEDRKKILLQLMYQLSHIFKNNIYRLFNVKKKYASPNYEAYFREIQKATNPWQVSDIYIRNTKQLSEKDSKYYIPVALRVFTRAITSDLNHLVYINQFLKIYNSRITSISINDISDQHLKDIMLFFYKFTQYQPILNKQMQVVIRQGLEKILDNKKNKEEQVKNVSSFFACIKLVHMYYPELEDSYIEEAIDYIIQNNKSFASQTFTLWNFLIILKEIYNPRYQKHVSLVKCIFTAISPSVQADQYIAESQVTVFISGSVIRNRNSNINYKEEILEDVLSILEKRILQKKLLLYNSRILDILISHLAKDVPHSSIMKCFYNILSFCISEDGQSKINPQMIVQYVTYLNQSQFKEYFNTKWQQKFIKMLSLYCGKNNKFNKSIALKILHLIQHSYFEQHYQQQLYQFYVSQYKHYEEPKTVQNIYILIQETIVHAKMKNFIKTSQNLNKIDRILDRLMYVWFHQKNTSKKFQHFLIKIPRLISLLGVQYKQNTSFGHSKQVKIEQFQQLKLEQTDKYHYFSQIKSRLFGLQIRLAYMLNKSQFIPFFFEELEKMRLPERQLLVLLKIIMKINFQQDHYFLMINNFRKIMKLNQMNFEESLFNLTYILMKQNQNCSKETAKLLTFLYEKQQNQLIAKLIKYEPVKIQIQLLGKKTTQGDISNK